MTILLDCICNVARNLLPQLLLKPYAQLHLFGLCVANCSESEYCFHSCICAALCNLYCAVPQGGPCAYLQPVVKAAYGRAASCKTQNLKLFCFVAASGYKFQCIYAHLCAYGAVNAYVAVNLVCEDDCPPLLFAPARYGSLCHCLYGRVCCNLYDILHTAKLTLLHILKL